MEGFGGRRKDGEKDRQDAPLLERIHIIENIREDKVEEGP